MINENDETMQNVNLQKDINPNSILNGNGLIQLGLFMSDNFVNVIKQSPRHELLSQYYETISATLQGNVDPTTVPDIPNSISTNVIPSIPMLLPDMNMTLLHGLLIRIKANINISYHINLQSDQHQLQSSLDTFIKQKFQYLPLGLQKKLCRLLLIHSFQFIAIPGPSGNKRKECASNSSSNFNNITTTKCKIGHEKSSEISEHHDNCDNCFPSALDCSVNIPSYGYANNQTNCTASQLMLMSIVDSEASPFTKDENELSHLSVAGKRLLLAWKCGNLLPSQLYKQIESCATLGYMSFEEAKYLNNLLLLESGYGQHTQQLNIKSSYSTPHSLRIIHHISNKITMKQCGNWDMYNITDMVPFTDHVRVDNNVFTSDYNILILLDNNHHIILSTENAIENKSDEHSQSIPKLDPMRSIVLPTFKIHQNSHTVPMQQYRLPTTGHEIFWCHQPTRLSDMQLDTDSSVDSQPVIKIDLHASRPVLVIGDTIRCTNAQNKPLTVDIENVICVDAMTDTKVYPNHISIGNANILSIMILIEGRWNENCDMNNHWKIWDEDGDTEIGELTTDHDDQSANMNNLGVYDEYRAPTLSRNGDIEYYTPPQHPIMIGTDDDDDENANNTPFSEYIYTRKYFIAYIEISGNNGEESKDSQTTNNTTSDSKLNTSNIEVLYIYELKGLCDDQKPLLVKGLYSETIDGCNIMSNSHESETLNHIYTHPTPAHIAIITGTCGLLALLALPHFLVPSTTCSKISRDSHTVSAIAQCLDDSKEHPDAFSAASRAHETNQLNKDSGMVTPTHAHNSNILHIDYDDQTKVLVTADHFGTICMWKYVSYANILLHRTIDSNISSQDPAISPICGLLLPLASPISLCQRITRIQLSPSSQQIAVSMTDKLILVAIGTSIINNTSISDVKYKVYKHPFIDRYYSLPQRPLYIHTTLDTLPKPKYTRSICAQYVVQFTCEEIKIWRFMNCNSPTNDSINKDMHPASVLGNDTYASVSDGIIVTYWSHPNLDYPLFITVPPTCGTSLTHAEFHISKPQGPNLVYSRQRNSTDVLDTNHSTSSEETGSLPASSEPTCRPTQGSNYVRLLMKAFSSENDPTYLKKTNSSMDLNALEGNSIVQNILEICCAMNMRVHTHRPTVSLVAAALELPYTIVYDVITTTLSTILTILPSTGQAHDVAANGIISPKSDNLFKWLCSKDDVTRIGNYFWIDAMNGHNAITALYLHYCANKSIAIEHSWQEYLKTYGPAHLRKCSRGLRLLTKDIRKIDETANIQGVLPLQLGYISGLQELYARRVGLIGNLPDELGELTELRVLSMGNNRLCGTIPASLGQLRNLQRIVLHQNCLSGEVPNEIGQLGCIINLAGNPNLIHGDDVPLTERRALEDLYDATKGNRWQNKQYWYDDNQPVSKWYKVGVLTSHVHSIVMSSNGMEGKLPQSIGQLTHLRMIELATMPTLTGSIPVPLCSVTSLRRLCICRCGLTGKIPSAIGELNNLEELQLFGNMLSGSIPSSISKLTNLRLLSLGEYTGGNNFTPGRIPTGIASLVRLEALFMANCQLTGTLPTWLGHMSELRQLDLQRNALSGSIPNEISECQVLLYLNLKDNEHLTGKIPIDALSCLTKLNRLSLVHCNFENATNETVSILQQNLPRCKIWM